MTQPQEHGSQNDEIELPFKLLQDRYEMIEAIGSGGMGSVYHAHDPMLVRDVAIKLLAWDIAPTPEQVHRMQREAQALARLKHPNILSIWDFVMDEQNRPFLIMEYIRGEDLDSILKNHGPLSQPNAVAVAAQICEGMSHAHAEGLLHRDLKPSNILLEESETELPVKIIDLGLAKFAAEDQALTKTGVAMGSPPYMSPEQVRGQPLEPSSDIYSLGCVLFTSLTGAPPYMASTAIETMSKHLSEPTPKLSDAAPNRRFPQSLEDVIAKCLEKERANRYQTMDELKTALLELLAGNELLDDDSIKPIFEKEERESESNKPLVILVCMFVISCIGMTALWLGFLQPPEEPNPKLSLQLEKKPFAEKVYEDGFSSYERGTQKGYDTLKLFDDNGLADAAKKGETNFHSFYFKGNDISGKGFAFFKNEPIDYACVAKGNLTDEGAKELSQVKAIRLLDASEIDKVSEPAFIKLISALPNLENLTFGSRPNTIESFKAVARQPKLRVVTVRFRRQPLPKGFGTELIKSKSLICLTLDDCIDLGVGELKELLPSRRLELFVLKSQEVTVPMAKVMAQLSANQFHFEGCKMHLQALTEIAKKGGVEMHLDGTTTADVGEVKKLEARGVLTH